MYKINRVIVAESGGHDADYNAHIKDTTLHVKDCESEKILTGKETYNGIDDYKTPKTRHA